MANVSDEHATQLMYYKSSFPPKEVWFARLDDPNQGGPPYWQKCSEETPGAVRYVLAG